MSFRKIIVIHTALIIFFINAFGVYIVYAQAEEKSGLSLSLKDAMAAAFQNNKDIQLQDKEIEAARADILKARSAFLPRVNVDAGYTYNSDVFTLSTQAAAKKDIGVFTGYKNDNTAGVVLEQPIFQGGANIARFKDAQLRLKVQEEILKSRKLDIEFETQRLYYGLLLAYQTERIARDLVSQAQAHYEQVNSKYEQGTASRFDLLQSKVQVSKLAPQLIKAKSAVDLISAQLKKLLGFKIDEPLTLKDTLEYGIIEINEADFLQQAYLNKPEMILQALGIDIGRIGIKLARSDGLPSVQANARYNYHSNDVSDMFNSRHNIWDAGFSVRIPLFDGFSSKAKVDAAAARYAQAVLNKENLTEQIAVDVRKACLDLKEAEAIINSQKDNIEEAKEAVRISEVSYDSGEGTNLEVLDAQVSLGQVENNLYSGIYDYLMAMAYLDRTMGKSVSLEADNEKKD